MVISSASLSSTSYLPLLLTKRTKLCVEAKNPSLARTKRKCSTQFYTLVREQNKIFGKSTKAKNPSKPPQKNKEQSRVKRRESQTRLGREQTNKNISGGQLKYKGNFQKVTDNTSMSNLSLNVPFFFTMPSKGFSFALVPGVRGRDSVSEYQ